MAELQRFAAQWDEIGKIDYLLNQVARSVERGEIPLSSYEALAPRYLERRAELVAVVSGANRAATRVAPAASAPTADSSARPPRGWKPSAEEFSAVSGAALPAPVPHKERKPVPWTTVLLFLGAFLVVVASAIFAVAVWDILGPTAKLAFMGTLTAGFYVAGWWARTKLELRAGSTALTAVASAMLLFDGWIVIDGYNLEGPLPWAAVLLVCSVAYWFTEMRLADRFFGVIGAAAQVGWWWMLGAGLGLTEPVRLAGIAVVVVAWQLASERGRDNPTVGTLAQVLEWAAPIVELAVVIKLIQNLVFVGSAGATEVVAGALVAGSGALVAARSRLLPAASRRWIAAAAQAPLVLAVAIAADSTGDSWWLAGTLALIAIAYAVAALYAGGLPFAVLGLVAESALALEVCRVLDVSDHTVVAVLALLAVTWAVASRLAAHLAEEEGAPPHAEEVALVAEGGAFALLVCVSAAVPLVSESFALAGRALANQDAVLAVGVLAAWYGAVLARPRSVTMYAGTLWSFYTLAALESCLMPDQSSAVYALGLVLLAALWLAGSARAWERFGDGWTLVARWTARAVVVVTALAGIALDTADVLAPTWWGVGLAVVAAAILAADAARTESLSAVPSGAFAVLAAGLAGFVAVSTPAGDADDFAAFAIAAASCGAVLSAALFALRNRERQFEVRLGLVTSAIAASALSAGAAMIAGSGPLALALAICAVAWVFAAAAVEQVLAAIAGLSVVGAVFAAAHWADLGAWGTLAAMTALAVLLGAGSFTRLAGPGGRLSRAGLGLVAAALAGQALVVVISGSREALFELGFGASLTTSPQIYSVALAFLGAHALVQGVRWRFEPAYYAAMLVLVFALWAELGALELSQAELYSTPLALYLIGMGYLSVRLGPDRRHPAALDAAAVAIGLGYPLWLSLVATPESSAFVHAVWVVALSLVAIGAGIALKVRWYFFGGVAALSLVALYRSFTALIDFWWLLLGVIGVAMLIIALTWERQRMVVSHTRERLKRSFEGWR